MEKQTLESLVDEGLSQREICKRLGSSQTNLRYYLKKFDIKTNHKKFHPKTIINGMATCKKHGLTPYSKKVRCKKCLVESVQKRRDKLKIMAVDYKGGKCEKCGYNKCIQALDFHHVNPSEKDFGIGHNGYTRSWEKCKKELDKCIILCANCHREIHSKIPL